MVSEPIAWRELRLLPGNPVRYQSGPGGTPDVPGVGGDEPQALGNDADRDRRVQIHFASGVPVLDLVDRDRALPAQVSGSVRVKILQWAP